jgi:hypothetical protein
LFIVIGNEGGKKQTHRGSRGTGAAVRQVVPYVNDYGPPMDGKISQGSAGQLKFTADAGYRYMSAMHISLSLVLSPKVRVLLPGFS